jgi:hypothetical protein
MSGSAKLFYTAHQPLYEIDSVFADGVRLDHADYCYDLVSGWVSLAEAPLSQVICHYRYSFYNDLAVSNWGGANYVFANTDAPPVDPGCCVGRVGDANGVGGDEPTIGDVSVMIDAKFISGTCESIECLAESDVNLSGGAGPICDDITIGDISILIDYLFITGSSLGLPDCL